MPSVAVALTDVSACCLFRSAVVEFAAFTWDFLSFFVVAEVSTELDTEAASAFWASVGLDWENAAELASAAAIATTVVV